MSTSSSRTSNLVRPVDRERGRNRTIGSIDVIVVPPLCRSTIDRPRIQLGPLYFEVRPPSSLHRSPEADERHPTRLAVETVDRLERIRRPPPLPQRHPTYVVNRPVPAPHATRLRILLGWKVVVSIIPAEEVEVRRGDCSARFNTHLESVRAIFALPILTHPLAIITLLLLLLNVPNERDPYQRPWEEVVVCQRPFIVMLPHLDREVITFMVLIMESVPRLPPEGKN